MRADRHDLAAAGLNENVKFEITTRLAELQLHEGSLETLPPKPSTGTSIIDFTASDKHVPSPNSQIRLWEARRSLADLAVKKQQALVDGPELARRLKASAREMGRRLVREFEGCGQKALDAVEEDMKKRSHRLPYYQWPVSRLRRTHSGR
jgi:hypothetical protein